MSGGSANLEINYKCYGILIDYNEVTFNYKVTCYNYETLS